MSALAAGFLLGVAACALAWLVAVIAAGWRDMGARQVTFPALTPFLVRQAPLMAYETIEITRAMQARDRFARLCRDPLNTAGYEYLRPGQYEHPAGWLTAVCAGGAA